MGTVRDGDRHVRGDGAEDVLVPVRERATLLLVQHADDPEDLALAPHGHAQQGANDHPGSHEIVVQLRVVERLLVDISHIDEFPRSGGVPNKPILHPPPDAVKILRHVACVEIAFVLVDEHQHRGLCVHHLRDLVRGLLENDALHFLRLQLDSGLRVQPEKGATPQGAPDEDADDLSRVQPGLRYPHLPLLAAHGRFLNATPGCKLFNCTS
mmetsp:Transcript_22061/g.75639  ORF Transcript_22061/g.75639 Transcript_22061/m.75639 type:complete len:211 (-) Transcript_22061:815-1447(-)